MGANVTIYCLEQVTDYFEFERLCSDLMSREGYDAIEPLGGFRDKGRDAIHVDRLSKQTTIFAYSVREDWQAKLFEDATNIKKNGHTCQTLVFLTTANYSVGDRDNAIGRIRDEFGWELELYGLERLRLLLEVQHADLKVSHPQIFPPDLLKIQALSEKIAGRRHLLILVDPSDKVFAEWLVRKLVSEKFLVWYEYFENISSELFPDDIEAAIENDTFRVLSIISNHALQNPDLVRLRNHALGVANDVNDDFLLPLLVEKIDPEKIDSKTRSLRAVSFEDNWAHGLEQLLKVLDSDECPRLLAEGAMLATNSFFERNNLTDTPEEVVSNCLLIDRIPEDIMLFEFPDKIPWDTQKSWKNNWSFRYLTPFRFLSFHHPPDFITNNFKPTHITSFAWRIKADISGILSTNLVSELLRKALDVHCHNVGLIYSSSNRDYYFPDGLIKGNRLRFLRPDGKKSNIQVVGRRKVYRPNNRSYHYRYHLSPSFRVRQNLFDDFVVLLQVGIRFTEDDGYEFKKSRNLTLRKHLTRDWWNKHWLNRTIAIAQFLGKNGKINIGEENEMIVIKSEPVKFIAPYGINEIEGK